MTGPNKGGQYWGKIDRSGQWGKSPILPRGTERERERERVRGEEWSQLDTPASVYQYIHTTKHKT